MPSSTGLTAEYLEWELEEKMQYIVQAVVVFGLFVLSLSLRETKGRVVCLKQVKMLISEIFLNQLTKFINLI